VSAVWYTSVCTSLPGPPPQSSHEEEEVTGKPPPQLLVSVVSRQAHLCNFLSSVADPRPPNRGIVGQYRSDLDLVDRMHHPGFHTAGFITWSYSYHMCAYSYNM